MKLSYMFAEKINDIGFPIFKMLKKNLPVMVVLLDTAQKSVKSNRFAVDNGESKNVC